jgi:hypothetical protein
VRGRDSRISWRRRSRSVRETEQWRCGFVRLYHRHYFAGIGRYGTLRSLRYIDRRLQAAFVFYIMMHGFGVGADGQGDRLIAALVHCIT